MTDSSKTKLSPLAIRARKNASKIAMLAAYDFPTARLIEEAGADVILVGDSLGMVVQGHHSTIPVTLDEIIYHCRTVVRGAPNTHVVADLPFLTYQQSVEQALSNAARLLREGGADSVKLEGGVTMSATIGALVAAGIPVMGHVGLGPQSVGVTGGFRVQGKDLEQARRIINDAIAVDLAGAFAVVMEMIPAELGEIITRKIGIPTIGIGAGSGCDGQVLVAADVIGLDDRHAFKFVRRYAEVGKAMSTAFRAYTRDVQSGAYPGPEHAFAMNPEILAD